MDSWNVMQHYVWIVQNELALYMEVKNEFALFTDSWTHYVWMNYFSQIVDSTIHEAFVYFN